MRRRSVEKSHAAANTARMPNTPVKRSTILLRSRDEGIGNRE
jgi:hypothetical protein